MIITKKTVKVLGAYWDTEVSERTVTFIHYTPLGSKTGIPFKVQFRRRIDSEVLSCAVLSDQLIRFGMLTQLNKIARRELFLGKKVRKK